MAWKEAADYIRNSKEKIRYPRTPIIDLDEGGKPKNTEHITKTSERKRQFRNTLAGTMIKHLKTIL